MFKKGIVALPLAYNIIYRNDGIQHSGIIYSFVGGLGRFIGPILGAVLLSLLTEPLRGFQYYERIFFAVTLVLVVLFLPGGLISIPEKLSNLRARLKRLAKPEKKGAV